MVIMRLRSRCDRQERMIAEMTKQLQSLRAGNGEVDQAPQTKAAQLQAAAPKPNVSTAGTQTEDDLIEQCNIQREQLDGMYASVGEAKSQVRNMQHTVTLLQNELSAQQAISEQFRDQVFELEERLRLEAQQRDRAEQEKTLLEWQLRTAKVGASTPRKGMPSGSLASQSTGCPSFSGTQASFRAPSLNCTTTGLETTESTAAARGAARMAQWDTQSSGSSEREEEEPDVRLSDVGSDSGDF